MWQCCSIKAAFAQQIRAAQTPFGAELLAYLVTQSRMSFNSGGQEIALDCFLPSTNGNKFPTIVGLHGSGGGHAIMSDPAELLAANGFAVYVLHYFDRTGTSQADRDTIFRHFPLWMKTLWDSVSFVARQPHVDPERMGLLGFSLGAYLSLSNAAIDSRVRAVVEFFGGLPKEMKFFMRRLCPVLILHGEADPRFRCRRLTICSEFWKRSGSLTKCRFTPAPATASKDQFGRMRMLGRWNFSKNIWQRRLQELLLADKRI